MSLFRPVLRVFIDESGVPDRWKSNRHESHNKYFTLAAVLIYQPEYRKYQQGIKAISDKYKEYLNGEEVKSNSIRRSNPSYVKGEDTPPYSFYLNKEEGQTKFDEFCADLKKLILETDFKVVSVTTNKESAASKYPHINLHHVLLNDLWERISIFIFIQEERPRLNIMFDETRGNADTILVDSYHRFKQYGSWYFSGQKLTDLNLDRSVYPFDSKDCIGIQLADLCAHPIKKQAENRNHKFFLEIVRPKLHRQVQDVNTRKRINMGMKISLL